MMRLYNYLSRQVEEFTPQKDNQVGFYTCGPTVYDLAHIGHARTYIFADILQRVLEFDGYKVKRVMNITDVGHLTSDSDTGEDKMEKSAVREHKSVWDIAKFYTADFFQMLDSLNIKRPEIISPAADHIKEMINLVKRLEAKGFTYQIADGIYFDTSKFPQYGQLMGQTFASLQKNLKAGARVEAVEGKKHPTDFALWKLTSPGVKRQMEWDSPWGKGFPGWHIECSAMSMKYLGETFDPFGKLRVNGERSRTIDIHTGGVDHVPIHHTNEIAQSEAATGKPFVRFFVEGEHLLVDGKKMAKSAGNFYTLKDIESKGFNPLALRYLFLTAHYRTQLNFTWGSLQSAQNALNKLYDAVSFWDDAKIGCAEYEQNFFNAVNEDLNTPQALAVMYQMLGSDYPDSAKARSILKFDQILGLGLEDKIGQAKKQPLPADVAQLIQERELARQASDFAQADKIRDKLEAMGWIIEDREAGPQWKKKR